MKFLTCGSEELRWRCHVCDKSRPDAKISVLTVDNSKRLGLPVGTCGRNIRYCNDDDECAHGAAEMGLKEMKSE